MGSKWLEDIPADEEIKELAWKHVDLCGSCGSCSGGTRKVIFGKEFDKVCGCTFRIDNPNSEDLKFMKIMVQIPYHEEHVTLYCKEADLHLIDMSEFREKLIEQVNSEICRDVERWNTEYVMKPSFYIDSKESIFYPYNQEIVNRECDYLINCQCEDGSYLITWQWWTDYKEFEVAKNWWKADFCIKNMIFLREFWREESEK